MTTLTVLTSLRTMAEQGEHEITALREIIGGSLVELFHDLPTHSIVVPRFRAIPFGALLEEEVERAGCKLINTYREHRAIADSSTWAHLLDGSDGRSSLSARQFALHDLPHLPEGEWFVKGETNSLKAQWLMGSYAPTTKDLTAVIGHFMNDGFVGQQAVVIKPFQRYRRLAVGVNGQPIFHERRVFVLDGRVMAEGFYWTSWEDTLGTITYDRTAYEAALQDAITRIGHLARFLVVDMAEYEDGHWGVVELNDGSMSGLSSVDPWELWTNVKEALS